MRKVKRLRYSRFGGAFYIGTHGGQDRKGSRSDVAIAGTYYAIVAIECNRNSNEMTPEQKINAILCTKVSVSFKEAVDSIHELEKTVGTDWYKVKNTSITHLAKLPAFSFDHLKIGGG